METLFRNEFRIWTLITIGITLLMVGAIWFAVTGSALFIVLGVLSITFLGLRDRLSRSAEQHTRSIGLSQIADELAFEFQESASFDVLGWPDCFELTKRAHALSREIDPSSMLGGFVSLAIPKARNVMTHSKSAMKVALFDYEYSENEVTYLQAVAGIASPELDFEYFGLFPASLGNHLADKFRATSMVLGDHRLVIDPTPGPTGLAPIEQLLCAKTTLEVGNGFLLLYRNDKRSLQPCEVRALLAEAFDVYSVVTDNKTELIHYSL